MDAVWMTETVFVIEFLVIEIYPYGQVLYFGACHL
jgi:hypothetical protein